MGIEYRILMIDEGNWEGYGHPYEKNTTLRKFEKEFEELRWTISLEGTGFGWAVYDISKTFPVIDKYWDCIQKYCDCFYYWADNSPWQVIRAKRLNPLPYKPPFQRADFDSEAMEKKLKEAGITPVWERNCNEPEETA